MELRVELPDEFVALLGETPEAAASSAREAVVVSLLRNGLISEGQAARVLGLNRHDMIDFMAVHEIPSGPATIEELLDEVETIEQYLRSRRG
jgi:hypothetical protein